MKKYLISILLLTLAIIALLTSCGQNDVTTTTAPTTDEAPAKAEEVRILALKGPTGMGLANVLNDAANNPDSPYKYQILAGPDLVKTEILLGNYDIAALPTNVAAALYNAKKADFQIAAVNTLGVLYVVENGNTVTDIQSLKGKTINATGKGSTPEYILRYVLEQNGIDPDKDVTLDFSYTEHAELAAHVKAGTVSIAVLPEPQVTSSLSGESSARVALNLTEEWGKVSETDVMQGCIVVRREFAEQYPEQLAEFLDAYRASVEYVNENPDNAATIIANLGIIPQAALAKSAIPRCNIVYVDGNDMKTSLTGFFTVLYNADPTSIGGKIPDENLYYQK